MYIIKSLSFLLSVYFVSCARQGLVDVIRARAGNDTLSSITLAQLETLFSDQINEFDFKMSSPADRTDFVKEMTRFSEAVFGDIEHQFFAITIRTEDTDFGTQSIGLEIIVQEDGGTTSRLYQSRHGLYSLKDWLGESNHFALESDYRSYLIYKMVRERFGKGRLIGEVDTVKLVQILLSYMISISPADCPTGEAAMAYLVEEVPWFNLLMSLPNNNNADIKRMAPLMLFGVILNMDFMHITARVYDASEIVVGSPPPPPAAAIPVPASVVEDAKSGADESKSDAAEPPQFAPVNRDRTAFKSDTNCYATTATVVERFQDQKINEFEMRMAAPGNYSEYIRQWFIFVEAVEREDLLHSFFAFDVYTNDAGGHSFGIELKRDGSGHLTARMFQSWENLFCLVAWMGCTDFYEGDGYQAKQSFGLARHTWGMGRWLGAQKTQKLLKLIYMFLGEYWGPDANWAYKTSYGSVLDEIVPEYSSLVGNAIDIGEALGGLMHEILPTMLFGVNVEAPAKMEVRITEYGPLKGEIWECDT